MQLMKKFFRELDMFPAPATFRIKEEPEMMNSFAGVISLLFMLLFTYVFIDNFVKTVDRQSIQYSISDEKLPRVGTEYSTDFVMYAFKIEDLDYTAASKIFSFRVTQNDNDSSGVYLQQCTPSHWQGLGQTYEEQFNDRDLKNYFCPPRGLILNNAQSQPNFISQLVVIKICAENTTSSCLSEAVAIQQLKSFIHPINFVQVNLAMLDTGFTPHSPNATVRFINDDPMFTFSQSRSIWMHVDYSRYRVETDQSIMPWKDKKIEEGVYVSYLNKENFENNGLFPFAYLHFRLKLKRKIIKRIVGKFDDLLSYAGGLFALIIGFLSFFLNSFNQYKYQILVAQGAFSYSQRGRKIKQTDLDLWFYIKYSIFDWLNILFHLDLQWGKCKAVDETRLELNKQIDTGLIMRRLQHIERCVFSTVNSDYKMGMYMHRSEYLQEVRLNRMYLEYYEWIIQGYESLTAENIETAENVFEGPPNKKDNLFLRPLTKSNSNLVSIALKKFKELEKQATSIKLTEKQLEVEKQLAAAFGSMNPKVKESIQMKIPLKILYRFKMYEKTESQSQSFSASELSQGFQ